MIQQSGDCSSRIKIINDRMQKIELKSIEEGYFFLCGICNQFPEIAVECNLCYKVYCLTCQQQIHLQEKRGCNCQFTCHEVLEPFQQFVYDRLTIKCLLCNELVPLNKNKKHKVKCQNKITKLKLLNDKCLKKINLIQKNTIYKQCQMNHFEQFDPENYRYLGNLKFQKSNLQQYTQSYQILSEDIIIQLQSAIFQCQLCQYEGNFFSIRQHHLFCKQEVVECICGFKQTREILKNHINQCLSEEISSCQIQKQQISQTINLQYIAFNQQLIQNRHVYKVIKIHNQFQGLIQDFETFDEY